MNKKNLEEYVQTTAELINLPLLPEHRPGVVANLEQLSKIAQLVLEFPLEKETEPAPKFEP